MYSPLFYLCRHAVSYKEGVKHPIHKERGENFNNHT